MHLRWRHRYLVLPALIVIASELLFRGLFSRRNSSRPIPPLDWGTGVSVVIPERGDEKMLAECLRAATEAASRVDEHVEIIVVVNGADAANYDTLRSRYPEIRWLHFPKALGFTRAVLEGLALVRHGSTYLLNSDMLLEAPALQTALQWRTLRIFGIATQIFMEGQNQRREETGWTAMSFDGARPNPRHLVPTDETVRGTVWAGAGAALYNTALLRELLPDCVVYDPFYWEDVDLGVRAWRMGYVSICCPASKTWHGHRVTVNRYYPQPEVSRIFERNRLQFLMRNPFPRHGLKATLTEISRCDFVSARELGGWKHAKGLWRTRLRAFRAPFRDLDYATMTMLRLRSPRLPRIVLASPFAILPPRHGGAVRTHRLATALAREYDVILLTDEHELHGELADGNFDPFSVVHFVHGRPAELRGVPPRIARIRSHSHAAFQHELTQLIRLYEPRVVLVEHMELAALIESAPADRPKFILSLQDVLLCPDNPREVESDRFELQLIDRFDGIVVSSDEDQQLLGSRISRLVINGFDANLLTHYRPSRGSQSILFVGPFRVPNNWEGILAFAEQVYPELEARVPGVSLTIVGGADAMRRIRECPALSRPSIHVVEHVEDLGSLFTRAALTVNPQQALRGSSLKVIESLALGRVCISTAAGARGRETEAFHGLLIVPTIADFLDPLVRLLTHEDERIAMEIPELDKLMQCTWEGAGQNLRTYIAEIVAGTVSMPSHFGA